MLTGKAKILKYHQGYKAHGSNIIKAARHTGQYCNYIPTKLQARSTLCKHIATNNPLQKAAYGESH